MGYYIGHMCTKVGSVAAFCLEYELMNTEDDPKGLSRRMLRKMCIDKLNTIDKFLNDYSNDRLCQEVSDQEAQEHMDLAAAHRAALKIIQREMEAA